MGWLDRLRGRESEEEGLHHEEVTPTEHERHLEQSANPGSAPVVPPDTSDRSADELEERRQESEGEARLEETRGRDDQEGRFTREPPQSF